MVIYNVTVSVDDKIHQEWLEWMQNKHIPDVLATGIFSEHKFCRIVSRQPDEEGHAYAIQYFCENLAALQRYQAQFAPALQAEHTKKFDGHFAAFRTILETI